MHIFNIRISFRLPFKIRRRKPPALWRTSRIIAPAHMNPAYMKPLPPLPASEQPEGAVAMVTMEDKMGPRRHRSRAALGTVAMGRVKKRVKSTMAKASMWTMRDRYNLQG